MTARSPRSPASAALLGVGLMLTAAGCSQAPEASRSATLARAGSKAAAPPAASATGQLSSPPGAATFSAVDAIVAVDRLIALEEDGAVVARQLDGIEVWRTPLGRTSEGSELLQRLPGAPRVLVRRPDGLVALDLNDGHVAARHAVKLDDRLYLWARDGACGLRGGCTMQLLDCETGRPFGSPIQYRYDGDFHDPDGEYGVGCPGFDVHVIGRVGDVVVYVTGAPKGEPTAFGVNARDGAEVWSSTAISCRHCVNDELGMSPEGSWCFTAQNNTLVVFACRSGEVRSTQKIEALDRALWAGDERGGIFVETSTSVALLNPANGSWRWRTVVPSNTIVIPQKARLTDLANLSYRHEKTTPLLLLNEATGQTAAKHTLQPGQTITAAADGTVTVADEEPLRDHTGQVLPSIMPAPAEVERLRRAEGSSGPLEHAVVRRADGQVIATISRDAWALGWSRSSGEVGFAVMIASKPRTVVLYRFTDAPRAR
jgi:hypothetical protein